MWWLRNRAEVDRLPDQRVVTQVDFYGAATVSFWLTLTRSDVMLCLTDPGYEINLLVTADLAMFYELWGGPSALRMRSPQPSSAWKAFRS
jgi:hypothetical protein